MMEPTKADSYRAGGAGDGAPVAQAMEEARVVPQQPSTGSNLGAAPTGGATAGAAPIAPTAGAVAGGGGAPLIPPGPGDGNYQPPQGAWKDHCFACFNQTSPSCLVSCFLPCCALAMLSKRMSYASYNKIFWGLLVLFVIGQILVIGAIFYPLAVLVITIHLLLIVRAKYNLPALVGEKKDGCIAITADVIATLFCTPCVISQMLRHTFNYTKQCDECNITESRVAVLV